MAVIVSKELGFDAGHRLLNHEGKCRHMHGHRYTAEVHVQTDHGLDAVGRVVDFGVIKRVVGGWIDEELDHGYIAQRGDAAGELAEREGLKVFWMHDPPTAENLAELIANTAAALLREAEPRVRVVKVVLWETPTSAAFYEVPRE